MTSALARIAEVTGYTVPTIEAIQRTIARDATEEEFVSFLMLAARSGLDPFSRQIYLIERRAMVNDVWTTTRQTLVGIDGLRLIADRTGNYAPGRAPTYEYDDGKLVSATAYVLKYVRDHWHEVAATAHYREYAQIKKNGSATAMWSEKPHIMLTKCAEALALRRAFPADMSGLYTDDEIPTNPPSYPSATVIDVATGEVLSTPDTPGDPDVVKMDGTIDNLTLAFSKRGTPALKFMLDMVTCIAADIAPSLAQLEDGDQIAIVGKRGERRGEPIVQVLDIIVSDALAATLAQRAANETAIESEAVPAPQG